LDVASTTLNTVEVASCQALLTMPWKAERCVCTTDKRSSPILNYVDCEVTIVPTPRLPGNPASVTVRFSGSYFFSTHKMTLTVQTKPESCVPDCNGVRVTL
jgi:hypothetical protein